jgi:hypothetical protein
MKQNNLTLMKEIFINDSSSQGEVSLENDFLDIIDEDEMELA